MRRGRDGLTWAQRRRADDAVARIERWADGDQAKIDAALSFLCDAKKSPHRHSRLFCLWCGITGRASDTAGTAVNRICDRYAPGKLRLAAWLDGFALGSGLREPCGVRARLARYWLGFMNEHADGCETATDYPCFERNSATVRAGPLNGDNKTSPDDYVGDARAGAAPPVRNRGTTALCWAAIIGAFLAVLAMTMIVAAHPVLIGNVP